MTTQDQDIYNKLSKNKLHQEATTLNNVFFSIITPVFNNSKYLNSFFESIINQTFRNFELIIVEDGSTDNSLEKINRYKDKFPFIKLIQQKNSGQGISRNKGMSLANGEYVLFMDSDDTLRSKTSLESLYNFIINKPSDIIIYSYRKIYYNRFYKNTNNNIALLKSNCLITTLKEKENLIKQRKIGVPWNKAYKRSFLEEQNVKFGEHIKFEDVYFFWQNIIKAKDITFFPSILYNYTKHSLSTMRSHDKNNMDIIEAYVLITNFLLKENILDQFVDVMLNRALPSFLSQFKKIPFRYKKEFFIKLKQFNVEYSLQDYVNNTKLYIKPKKILAWLNIKSFWKFYLKSFLI